jgi:hypothetical protein
MWNELIKSIIEKRWLVLFVSGIFVFLIGAGGGLMALQLKEPTWRSAVAVFGFVLTAISGYGMIREGQDQDWHVITG